MEGGCSHPMRAYVREILENKLCMYSSLRGGIEFLAFFSGFSQVLGEDLM